LTLTARSRLLRPGIALVTALVLVCVGLGFRASEANAARGMEISAQDDAAIVTESYRKRYRFTRTKGLRAARRFGVTRLRINVVWANTLTPSQRRARSRPSSVRYQFPYLDDTIDAAARYGIRVQLSITPPAPAWAAGNRRAGVFRPSPTAFGEWAGIVAQHFAGRVDRISIGNEGNIRPWLSPMRSSARIYRRLYQRAYNAIKAVSPGTKVLIGETSPYGRRRFSTPPLRWLRGVLCVNSRWRLKRGCSTLRADGYAHHPYEFSHSPTYRYPGRDNVTMGTLSRLTRALDRASRGRALRKNGGGRMPVYLTEYGYFASGHRKLPTRRRTRYLYRGWSIALRNRRVRSNLQYLIAAPPRGFGSYFNLAVMTTRGRAYPQFRTLTRWYRANRRRVKRARGPIVLPPRRPQPPAI
jgi:Cellulase (glycosyl hydrolase family 5)